MGLVALAVAFPSFQVDPQVLWNAVGRGPPRLHGPLDVLNSETELGHETRAPDQRELQHEGRPTCTGTFGCRV